MPMTGGFRAWLVVQCARRDDESLAVAGSMWHRTVAPGTDLPGEAFRLRKIKSLDQLFAGYPAKLIRDHRNICRAHPAGGFPAAGAIAMAKSQERRLHLIADRFAKTTSSKRLIGHLAPPESKVVKSNRSLLGFLSHGKQGSSPCGKVFSFRIPTLWRRSGTTRYLVAKTVKVGSKIGFELGMEKITNARNSLG